MKVLYNEKKNRGKRVNVKNFVPWPRIQKLFQLTFFQQFPFAISRCNLGTHSDIEVHVVHILFLE